MKDLGEATFILGIHIYIQRSRMLFRLSQSMYIDIIVKRFVMENFKKGFILMGRGVQISKEYSPKTPKYSMLMEKISYISAIGSTMYDMLCIRLYVTFTGGVRPQSPPRHDTTAPKEPTPARVQPPRQAKTKDAEFHYTK